MADSEALKVDGKNLSDLRVVDLKRELEKRGLSKSGRRKELLERLKSVILFVIVTKINESLLAALRCCRFFSSPLVGGTRMAYM